MRLPARHSAGGFLPPSNSSKAWSLNRRTTKGAVSCEHGMGITQKDLVFVFLVLVLQSHEVLTASEIKSFKGTGWRQQADSSEVRAVRYDQSMSGDGEQCCDTILAAFALSNY
jgi:hypothetical protein